MMNQRINLLVFLSVMSSFASADPGSNAGFSGSGGATNGQVQLGMQSISSMNSDGDIPQAISQAQNTASGTSIYVNGNTNSFLSLYPPNTYIDPSLIPVYVAYNNANSDGKAVTGTLNTSDQSHSNTTGQQHFSIGQSQFTGNGTGMSMSATGASSINRGGVTPQPPSTTHCYSYNCNHPCYADQYCNCVCPFTPPYLTPTPVTVIPFMDSKTGKRKVLPHSGNRQRKPVQANEKKQRQTAGAPGRTRKEESKAPTNSRGPQGTSQGKLARDQHISRAVQPALHH